MRDGLLTAVLVATAWLVGVGSPCPAAEGDRTKPNIVFILADDLGYTDLGCCGSTYYETPHIDRLAARGMRFTSGYTSAPNCAPTRAALMSGQYMPRTGVYTVGGIERFDWQSRQLRPVDNVTKLAVEKTTVAEALKKAGYATGMFGKWHLGNDPDHHPSSQGFDEAIVASGRHFRFRTVPKTAYPPGTYLADFLAGRAVDFIRRHKGEPFFLYLPHFAVHTPLQAKKELIARFKAKPPGNGHNNPTYAAMIASLDESVGRVLDVLDDLKLASNTLVIFSSDNGGVGGYEREGIKGKDITDNKPLKGGKGMLYEGGIRVPYLFCWPGTIAAGSVCEAPIISVDLYPTLLELAGAKPPAAYPLDGHSYARLLTHGGKADKPREPLFWHFPGYLGSGGNTWRTLPVGVIRAGDFKLMEFFEDNRLELYNLRKDIGEKHNLAASHPDKVKELHARLIAWRQELKAPMPTKNEEIREPRGAKRGRRGQKARRGREGGPGKGPSKRGG